MLKMPGTEENFAMGTYTDTGYGHSGHAEMLGDASAEIRREVNELQDICSRISAGWKGDCADRYIGKLSATLDELERLQKDITAAAEDLRGI